MSTSWREELTKEWKARHEGKESDRFELVVQSYDEKELIAMVEVLLSGKLTMGENVAAFERAFANYIGAPYAVMVNSGSSANLLALAVMANPTRSRHLKAGDEVLVPAVCWSTSVWPIMQMGLTPVFVDVDPYTMNANLDDLERKITPKTKGLVAVHIMGNACDMQRLKAIIDRHQLIVLEDTCESLGSRSTLNDNKFLGAICDFGSYSFFFSHHMTTGEGGMVTCQTLEDYDLLLCLRAHGWTRMHSKKAELEAANPQVDPRFLFVNVGYNLRPIEVEAAMGLVQLERVNAMNQTRIDNRGRLIAALKANPKFDQYFELPVEGNGIKPVWFGFCCFLKAGFESKHQAYLQYLSANKVENRPIVSGNFVRQPAFKLFNLDFKPEDYPGAEIVNNRGFFIGLHTTPLSEASIAKLVDVLLGFEF